MKNYRDDDAPYMEMGEQYQKHEPPARKPEERFDTFLFVISIGVFFSVLMGMNSVLDGEGVARNALVLFVGALAGTFSLQANKASFHTGSKLAAAGDRFTITLVIWWFVLMATVVGTIGFGGVSREMVEGAKLREPIQAMSDAKRRVGESVNDAQAISPLISAIAGDLQSIATCEARSGCVSGRAGRGPEVARLEAFASRIRRVERTFKRSDRRRAQLETRFTDLISKYEAQLSKGGVTGESRARLLAIYTQAQSLVTEMSAVVPTAAARGLAGELRSLPVAPARRGRIDVAARLRAHADRIDATVGETSRTSLALPPFPSPSGIAVGWERLDLTWPLALVLFGLEIILVVLWLLMVRDFRARRISIGARHADRSGADTPRANGAIGRRGMIGRRDPKERHNSDGDLL